MTTVEPAPALPRWDLSPYFRGLDDRDLLGALEEVASSVGRFQALCDERDVRAGEPRAVSAEDGETVELVLTALDELMARSRLVGAYLYAHTTTDARDDEAARLSVELQASTASLSPLIKRVEGWVARLGADALAATGPVARDHAFWLERAARLASHQMSEAEEGLAAELGLTGGRSWARLHGEMTATLTATVDLPDEGPTDMPVTEARGLAAHPDGAVRRAAFDGEVAAWRSVEMPLALALASHRGEMVALDRRRGWEGPLEVSLATNNVDRATLDALTAAVRASLPTFARYHRAKGASLGHGDRGLPWWDLLAPLGTPRRFTWDEAVAAVEHAFGTYSPGLVSLLHRAVGEGWIDAEPRPGKVGGAFCMPVRDEESRVLLSFDGSFNSVQTLAHELGHAYHNTQLGHRPWLLRATPMALAETASIFCETVMVEAGLAAVGDDVAARLAILDGDLVGSAQVVVDIHSRFLFEQALSAERARGAVGPARMTALMAEAQDAAYLDGVDPDHRHPHMWAVKGHYYTAFYNWPYTFGLLFGLGLYAEFRRDPERFRGGYDDLLGATGLGDAAPLAARFGIDIRDEAFWASSLDVIGDRIEAAVALMG
ncbi:M3 family oligoendopeptidase [Iamia sp. SCSIO 61187]|uniref:M3 family oligoendopeptidase n=1 Tax=Iamia sp. SCSIO 61187 TaxID=2722752 RepID=UPI001C637841|nr:M3 family oligoendopeptidase [Iamia sp. SCSIO 61187]QYG94145.1 M3 family oligoendopeptidase [Iamia sp. SCSIO 61187]